MAESSLRSLEVLRLRRKEAAESFGLRKIKVREN